MNRPYRTGLNIQLLRVSMFMVTAEDVSLPDRRSIQELDPRIFSLGTSLADTVVFNAEL